MSGKKKNNTDVDNLEDLGKPKSNFSYAEKAVEIDKELHKRRAKWFLTSIAWFDFDDVCQIIRAHIFAKWDHWDQARPLEPWVNRIISNQFKNILRNHYSNFVRPCLNCPFNNSENSSPTRVGSHCGFTPSGLQCAECPLFAKWEKTKKSAYDIKMAVTLEAEQTQVLRLQSDSFDIISAERKLHAEMQLHLPSKQFYIYKLLFIEHREEDEIAELLGYRSNEKGRKAGYKQIKNLRKKFKEQAIILLKRKDIC
jgi:DNA-directed RNA polymerase specialized sigma24 family protein